MYKIEADICPELEETTYHTTLENGLDIYICKKPGFQKKIGMFGTKYGSLINDFLDVNTKERTQVPDGIAHFLEHKLFEKEGQNALDVFSEIGVTSNAYTTFDHTVFYFETVDQFEKSIALLVKLVKEPYFTDENVAKEQGIIGQEIMMGDDDPGYMIYFNTLKAMYQNNNVKIDIAGTIDSISKITKDYLYTCYHTFYQPNNMFFVVVGDVEVEETIRQIDQTIQQYEQSKIQEKVTVFQPEEPTSVAKKEIKQQMDIYMPQICLGFKLPVCQGKEIIKKAIIADMVSELYFSKMTAFFQELYEVSLLSEPPILSYEGVNSFSHVIINAESTQIIALKDRLISYIETIQKSTVDQAKFENVKKSKIGNVMLADDTLSSCYRRIIDSILTETAVYDDIRILEEITPQDITDFLKSLKIENMVVSIMDKKEMKAI